MFKNAIATTLSACLIPVLLVPGIAFSQVTKPVSQKPETPRIALPSYESVFVNYKPYTDEKASDWKGVNSQVERRGGWRQYAKEAQEPEVQVEAPAPRPTPPNTVVVPQPKP